jgi:glycosyltransferase involved in cell wall biosynthesis
MMELISVIVPVYRVEEYLDRCVQSIVNQTYSNLEILLVDDGSPDRCPMMCEKWAEKDLRIKVIHRQNGGISAARNTGVANSTGPYILMVDSDDYLYAGMIETLYRTLLETDADLAICDYKRGREDNYIFRVDAKASYEIVSAKEALIRAYMSSDSALQYIAPWGKLYKRSLFDGLCYPEGKIFEDIYLTHKILYRCGRIAVVPQKMVYYFQRETSIMNAKFHVKKLDYLEGLKERIVFFEQHGLNDLAEIAYDEYLHALVWEYSRVRDLLGDTAAMRDISMRYRNAYRKGYASKRYPKETARFLRAFYHNPEWIIVYWKINSKWKKLTGEGKRHG